MMTMAISTTTLMRFLQEPTRTLRTPRERVKVTGRALSQGNKVASKRQLQLTISARQLVAPGLMYAEQIE
jgi:hypothetical protein